MDLGIRGRKAIVCAASKGLGKGCATHLAREGVELVINSRSPEALEATAAEIRAATGVKVSVLRAPGIYAADRLPVERLRRGTPALRDEDDVFTNHIHAEDLAAICVAALERAGAGGIYNASDDSALKMAAYFDLVAERAGLPPPVRISRAQARQQLNPVLLSFMSESRRLINTKMKNELGVVLRYPTVYAGVPDMRGYAGKAGNERST